MLQIGDRVKVASTSGFDKKFNGITGVVVKERNENGFTEIKPDSKFRSDEFKTYLIFETALKSVLTQTPIGSFTEQVLRNNNDLSALEQDKKRMDWISHNCWGEKDGEIIVPGKHYDGFDFREAIDEAMSDD
jgi:hypothetical protein